MDTTPSGRIRNTVNAPFTTPWIAPLGKLVMNFAGIEFQSYLWLAYLTKGTDVLEDATRQRFGSRADRICRLARENLEEPLRADALAAWEDAKEVARVRNAILHNPVCYWWTGDETGPPGQVAIIDMRGDRRLIRLPDVNGAVNRSAHIAQRLDELLNDVKTWLDRTATLVR